MHPFFNRLALFAAFLLFPLVRAGYAGVSPQASGTSAAPVFLTGTTTTSSYPYYQQTPFNEVPVGKTLVLPVVISGSGPMSYSVSSSTPALQPIIKTGYPVLNIHVTAPETFTVSSTATGFYSFTGGTDGATPYSSLDPVSSSLFYGTAETSGTGGAGTVFALTSSGSFSTLHAFTGGADGGNPYSAVITGTDGALYGTTSTGGSGSAGTIYSVTTSGTFATVYSFTGGADGGNPYASLVIGPDGNYYGTTSAGGTSGLGTVFQLTTSGSFTSLYSFTGGADGANPYASLVTGTDGNLYGTTTKGGSGAGTVFKITTGGSLTPLYSFGGDADGSDPYANLVQGSGGVFYGTTVAGGTSSAGTVYQVSSSGSFATIYTFTGGSDGGKPYAALITGSDGDLYGTTETDGTNGKGTVFKLTTSGSLTTLFTFTGGSDGGHPYAALAPAGSAFYGTASTGGTTATSGTGGFGTVYDIPTTNKAAISGTMTFALLRDMAPKTVGYVAGFAQAGFYNNTQFFRITNLASTGVQSEYIAQGGDPTETGTGGPGFTFSNEFNPSLIYWGIGQLAMANSGIDQSTFQGTNGSQFFISEGQPRHLDFANPIFGQLLHGFDVMQQVMAVTTGTDGSTPVTPVVMDSVTVSEDNTDAILLVSAGGAAPNGATIKITATDPYGNKAVSMSGTTSTPGLSFQVATIINTINDPPIIYPLQNTFAAVGQKISMPVKVVDLEYDYMITGVESLSNPSGASVTMSGNVLKISSYSYALFGGVTAGLYVYQPFQTTERSDEYDQTAVTAALGTGKLTAEPGLFTATSGIPLASSTSSTIASGSTFGTFLSSNPNSNPSDFTATINWGDGTALASGTGSVGIIHSGRLPTSYDVTYSSNHIYAHSGIYPLDVTVTNTSGGVLDLQETADIGPGPIYAFGRTFAAAGGSANCLVATFVDHSPNVVPADYAATINWGDGTIGAGVIRGSQGSFQVYGKHKYTVGTTYPVDVTINSTITTNSAYAWSTAALSGVPAHQPPYPQSHIVGQLSNPGYGSGYLDEEVTLFNSGNLPSGKVTLMFYLSPTSATDPIDSAAIALNIGSNRSYTTVSIPAGQAISGAVSDIVIPSGVVTRNKYLIMQVISPDPIGSHMVIAHEFADPNPLIQ